jgi:GGDEF domain-containing protein
LTNKKGHLVGDEHINNVVINIKDKLSSNCIFIIYGGDEFIILSNINNLFSTNTLYTYGKVEILSNFSLNYLIDKASKNMIKNKRKKVLKNK